MSEQIQHYNLTSSQDFVRSLKASSDPPVTGGPFKIDIARQCWNNTSFYVPSKAEVISEWVFTKLIKDKGKDLSSNPLFDARYWDLVASLLNTRNPPFKSSETRSPNAWLTPLLHRLAFGPVMVAFLTAFGAVEENQQRKLAGLVSTCLNTIWPIVVQRMSAENLQECFGALLCALSSVQADDGIIAIGQLVSVSYRNSLANSSNKRKLHQIFLQSHLKLWVQSLALNGSQNEKLLKDAVLEAGMETLFNLDILRQSQDSKAGNPLIERLLKLVPENRDIVYGILPDLFSHCISATKKNRGALFSQGSQSQPGASLEQLHEACLRFVLALFSLVDHGHQDHHAWRTRFALLNIIDQENLFDRTQLEAQMTFNEILELVIVALNDGWQEERIKCTTTAVECLSTISRIDYDIVIPFVPRILPLLLQIPILSGECFRFLDIQIAYHTKTRTMGTLVQDLFSSLSNQPPNLHGSLERYQLFLSSPVMHDQYLGRLSNALHIFLTQSQCLPALNLVLDLVKVKWDTLLCSTTRRNTESTEGPRKKRKLSSDPETNPDTTAVTYSLVCRLASVVLSSLPVPSLSADALEDTQRLLNEFRSGFLHQSLAKSMKIVKKQGSANAWCLEIAIAANLRLLYALNVSKNLYLPLAHDDKVDKRVLDLTAKSEVLPELVLELYRNILYNLSIRDTLDHTQLLERLFEYLSRHFTASDVQWSGQVHHLTNGEPGRAESSLALLHLVLERWLDVIDRLASPEQIEKLLKIIISINLIPSSSSSQQVKPEDILLGVLHSAQFWEFQNIRAVFSTLLDKKTTFLDPSSSKSPKPASLLDKLSIYRYLLLFPMEYFPWKLLNDLMKRALAADSMISRLLPRNDIKGINTLTVLRVFLKRAYIHRGFISQDSDQESTDYLLHLLRPAAVNNHCPIDFIKATLDLVELYFSKMLKNVKNNGSKCILDVLKTFTPDTINTSTLQSSSFISIVNLLEREFPSNSLPEEILATLVTIHSQLSSTLIPRITHLDDKNISTESIKIYSNLVSGWYSVLGLGKWLAPSGHTVQPEPTMGEKITSNVVKYAKQDIGNRNGELDGLCSNTFAVLLQELGSRPLAEHAGHLDVVLATYISFCNIISHSTEWPDRNTIDSYLAKHSRMMEISDYLHTLSLIADSLASDVQLLSSNHLLHLVHLASIMLHDHPTHALVYIQKFTTRCINIFNENPIFVKGPIDLRLQVLELISQHCSGQPAALRSIDTTGVWLFLFKHLAPSQEHDDTTEPAIFHKIVSILSSLIRLRRDLVTHALPHLGMVLRRLILCTRACRSQLGAKQTSIIMATQPRWVSASHPLGGEEAKALGRLLENLNTKTTVRSFASISSSITTAEPQKAESLSKPFSKHAAYVLEAYIEAMNDPLCVLSLEVRKELQPGMFALCGMMSEHSRDALMASALDTGGKATLKALWKDYEKQRYVGKG
uniref:Nucleolar 27S pre-rRNA processing Urb2/Npa2 C-terminal domain-containing protein n=1 Tax=Psilocybe cubensis TaxID=181762 RepID=A0A8H7Y6I5_PSICU